MVTLGAPLEMGRPVSEGMKHSLEAVGFDVIEEIVYSDDGGRSPASDDLELMKKMKALGLNFRNT